MTNEEAINNLKKYCYGCEHDNECGECEIHIACYAIEKQIDIAKLTSCLMADNRT